MLEFHHFNLQLVPMMFSHSSPDFVPNRAPNTAPNPGHTFATNPAPNCASSPSFNPGHIIAPITFIASTLWCALALSLVLSSPVHSQSVTVSTQASSLAKTNAYTGRIVASEVRAGSAGNGTANAPEEGEVAVELYTGAGSSPIHTSRLAYSKADDASLRLLVFPDGRFSVIDNDVAFTMGHLLGAPSYTASTIGASVTTGSPAFIAANQSGSTVLVVHPRIVSQGRTGSGSRISLLTDEGTFETLFSDARRQVLGASVSEDGLWIAFVTSVEGVAGGEQDQAIVMDRHGSVVAEFSPGSSLTGATLSEDTRFLTAYSRSRVLVYDVATGKRVGSVSTRSPILSAAYDADQTALIVLTEEEVQAVDLSKAKIARTAIPAQAMGGKTVQQLKRTGAALSNPSEGAHPILSDRNVRIQKTGRSTYRIIGPDADLLVRTNLN